MRHFILIMLLSFLLHAQNEQYAPKNFDHLIGNTPGFSDDLLKMHFKLYQGYVTNTNKLIGLIRELDEKGNNRGPEFAGLKRMFGWEFDGMRLHEYYFENLGGKNPLNPQTTFTNGWWPISGATKNGKRILSPPV